MLWPLSCRVVQVRKGKQKGCGIESGYDALVAIHLRSWNLILTTKKKKRKGTLCTNLCEESALKGFSRNKIYSTRSHSSASNTGNPSSTWPRNEWHPFPPPRLMRGGRMKAETDPRRYPQTSWDFTDRLMEKENRSKQSWLLFLHQLRTWNCFKKVKTCTDVTENSLDSSWVWPVDRLNNYQEQHRKYTWLCNSGFNAAVCGQLWPPAADKKHVQLKTVQLLHFQQFSTKNKHLFLLFNISCTVYL